MSEETKPAFNDTLVGLYETKTGFWSLPLDSKGYDNFMKFITQGCRVSFKTNKHRKSDKSPHAFLEVLPKAKVDAMESFRRDKPPADEI